MTTTKAKTGRKPARKKTAVDATAREQMIAEAAYYRAENRAFEAGDELQDWLQAESEVDHRLGR